MPQPKLLQPGRGGTVLPTGISGLGCLEMSGTQNPRESRCHTEPPAGASKQALAAKSSLTVPVGAVPGPCPPQEPPLQRGSVHPASSARVPPARSVPLGHASSFSFLLLPCPSRAPGSLPGPGKGLGSSGSLRPVMSARLGSAQAELFVFAGSGSRPAPVPGAADGRGAPGLRPPAGRAGRGEGDSGVPAWGEGGSSRCLRAGTAAPSCAVGRQRGAPLPPVSHGLTAAAHACILGHAHAKHLRGWRHLPAALSAPLLRPGKPLRAPQPVPGRDAGLEAPAVLPSGGAGLSPAVTRARQRWQRRGGSGVAPVWLRHGHPREPRHSHGYPRESRHSHGSPGTATAPHSHGYPRESRHSHGNPRTATGAPAQPREPRHSHGHPRDPRHSQGSPGTATAPHSHGHPREPRHSHGIPGTATGAPAQPRSPRHSHGNPGTATGTPTQPREPRHSHGILGTATGAPAQPRPRIATGTPGQPREPRDSHGHPGTATGTPGQPLEPRHNHGHPGTATGTPGQPRSPRHSHGPAQPRDPRHSHGSPGTATATHGNPRTATGTPGQPREPRHSHGIPGTGPFLAHSAAPLPHGPRDNPHVCTLREQPESGTGCGGSGCRGPQGAPGRRDWFYWQTPSSAEPARAIGASRHHRLFPGAILPGRPCLPVLLLGGAGLRDRHPPTAPALPGVPRLPQPRAAAALRPRSHPGTGSAAAFLPFRGSRVRSCRLQLPARPECAASSAPPELSYLRTALAQRAALADPAASACSPLGTLSSLPSATGPWALQEQRGQAGGPEGQRNLGRVTWGTQRTKRGTGWHNAPDSWGDV
ncbi:collagen alpha-1(III) chain-like [Poecile atricapillus]|uniref:collagen alpha-1(III) chain-like n=1 Tax=Poecile atricapillus TaxID=48891 RepID=UPI00273A31E6|nr:collagen alpha-1(III) chain-like [Poecile atricapillus]